MRIREGEPRTELNWVAILAYAASLVYSVAIWMSVISVVQHFVR